MLPQARVHETMSGAALYVFENLWPELVGITLTLLFIDTLYRLRTKQSEIENARPLITALKYAVTRIQEGAFTIIGGLPNVPRLRLYKEATAWLTRIAWLRTYNQTIEELIDRYSAVVTPDVAIPVWDIIHRIDEALDDAAILVSYQITFTPELAHRADLMNARHQDFGDNFTIDRMFSSGRNPAERTLTESYASLKALYSELDTHLESVARQKVTFWKTFTQEFVLLDPVRRSRQSRATGRAQDLAERLGSLIISPPADLTESDGTDIEPADVSADEFYPERVTDEDQPLAVVLLADPRCRAMSGTLRDLMQADFPDVAVQQEDTSGNGSGGDASLSHLNCNLSLGMVCTSKRHLDHVRRLLEALIENQEVHQLVAEICSGSIEIQIIIGRALFACGFPEAAYVTLPDLKSGSSLEHGGGRIEKIGRVYWCENADREREWSRLLWMEIARFNENEIREFFVMTRELLSRVPPDDLLQPR